MHPGTSYPTTPYPAVVIPVSVAANAPTYAPNGPPAATNGGYTPAGQPADPLLASREQVPSYAPASQPYTVPAQNQPDAGSIRPAFESNVQSAGPKSVIHSGAGNQAYSVQPQTTPYNAPPAGSYNPTAPYRDVYAITVRRHNFFLARSASPSFRTRFGPQKNETAYMFSA